MMKMTRQAKARLTFFGPICILIILIFAFRLGSYVKTIYNLENETAKLNELYASMQDEGDKLGVEISKLKDPEYLAKYARENYDYSKADELIIKINDTNKKIDDLNEKQYNNKFVLIVISFVLLGMIFIYVIGRGSNNKKNKKSKKK